MNELFAEHNESLIRFIMRRAKLGRDVAEDIAQATWLRAHKSHHRFDESRSFRNWLWKMATRAIAEHFSRKRLETTSLWNRDGELIEEGLAIDEPPGAAIEDRERQEKLRAAIDRLEPKEQEVIRGVNLAGKLLRDVAAEMGLTLWTIEWRVKRAQKRLSYMLRDAG